MKTLVRQFVGSVCTWMQDAFDYDFPDVDRCFSDTDSPRPAGA